MSRAARSSAARLRACIRRAHAWITVAEARVRLNASWQALLRARAPIRDAACLSDSACASARATSIASRLARHRCISSDASRRRVADCNVITAIRVIRYLERDRMPRAAACTLVAALPCAAARDAATAASVSTARSYLSRLTRDCALWRRATAWIWIMAKRDCLKCVTAETFLAAAWIVRAAAPLRSSSLAASTLCR
eukprot:scaffold33435_cov32-Tisochrysis_lutea.AAC.3